MTTRVAPARRRGLADEVADSIRDAIFSGAYELGAQLREVELAAALEVSRGPVREALLRLEREGLVRSAWHRGATVMTLSPEDIAELDSLRGALERLAVELVVAQASDTEGTADASGLDAIEQAAARMSRAEDAHAMVRADIEFHDAVYAAAGHRRLFEAWQAIRSQVHLFLLTRVGVSTEDYLSHIPGEHRDLVAALRSRDTETALRLFAAHRRHAFELVTTKR
ncbi:GntR family transcriptional regulator [Actinophytocola algeriensis]|uniref:DNA-binding GntR family transcriptional regulator n=1 Tax=Actinophytocola algeriensis TaxID=1768010 RepID=A0A7W7PZY1_9PSEU|nr:GntR family transcriptional regulator [Actinophytocola algeriensis]MBB4904430.1 DNA-binding GntR family transcriptional regulator [Actinophytocola algeriensis]MBE1476711.1 DNA-binding GntR family transcriptional regulator [Actinophytocola algeriensis]